jgi:hypothetical protein
MSFMAEIYTITLKTVRTSGVSGCLSSYVVIDLASLVLINSLSCTGGIVQIPNNGQTCSNRGRNEGHSEADEKCTNGQIFVRSKGSSQCKGC